MLAFIIIFAIALIVSLLFIYIRIYKIRIGEIKAPEDSLHKDRKLYTKVVETKEITTWYGKNIFKLAILLFLKILVFANFLIKQVISELREYVKERLIHKKVSSGENPSAFLGVIRDYKKELTKFQKNLDKHND